MTLISTCSSFPRDEVFYLFPYECLQSVSDFQQEIDSIPQEYEIHPRSYHVALCSTAARGNLPVVKKIVEILATANTNLFEYGGSNGRTPLIWAVIHGQYCIVKFLISAKADVNTATREGKTALWYAANSRQVRLAEYLLEKEAVINPQLNDRGMRIIERVQVALNHEKNIQKAFLRSLHALLNASIPSMGTDVNGIIIQYADPFHEETACFGITI